jgi:hypothetical protein
MMAAEIRQQRETVVSRESAEHGVFMKKKRKRVGRWAEGREIADKGEFPEK